MGWSVGFRPAVQKRLYSQNFKALLLAPRAQARFFLVYGVVFSALTLSICGGFDHIFNHENMASFGHNQPVGPVTGRISCCTYVLLPSNAVRVSQQCLEVQIQW